MSQGVIWHLIEQESFTVAAQYESMRSTTLRLFTVAVLLTCLRAIRAASERPWDTCKRAAGVPGIPGFETTLHQLLKDYNLPHAWLGRKDIPLEEVVSAVHTVAAGQRYKAAQVLTTPPVPPIDGALNPTVIPRNIHVTVKSSEQLNDRQALSLASWALLNPRHTIYVWTDHNARAFMTTHHPDLLATYDELPSPVERTDMWRYAVVCTHGGFYADADTLAAQPIDAWPLSGAQSWWQLHYRAGSYWDGWAAKYARAGTDPCALVNSSCAAPHVDAIVGFESHHESHEAAQAEYWARQHQVQQWAFGGKPGHPLMCGMGARIRDFALREKAGEFIAKGWSAQRAVFERTGPGVWTDAVDQVIGAAAEAGGTARPRLAAYVDRGGDAWGDDTGSTAPLLRILPVAAMGCDSQFAQLSRWARPPPVLLYHMFANSWKI